MKQKYNWDKLKLEYFSSPINEVKWFFLSKYSTYTGHIKTMTKWWNKEKQEFVHIYKAQSKEELRQELKEWFKPSVIELSKIYEAIMFLIRAKAINLAQKVSKDEKGNIIVSKDIKVSELKMIWEIVRTELWLPIKYNSNDVGVSFKDKKKYSEIVFF